jgi:hypothetical protein
MIRHIDEEAQQLLTDYRDNRARQKMLDNKAIYKRLVTPLLHGSSLQGQQGQAEDAGQQGHL